MIVIEAMLGEHGAFNAIFDSIENLTETGEEARQISAVATILNAEVNAHAQFEEDVLIPALASKGVSAETFAEIYDDHIQILDGLERIEDAVDIQTALEATQQTIALARLHFEREENGLYVLARRILDDVTLARLGDAWGAAHNVKVN